MQHYRAFWSAVVLQAHHDIETLALGSTEYEQAVAFFTAPGDWRDSLGAIADMLDLHPDDLQRAGCKAIKARRLVEGLPEAEAPKPHPKPVQRREMRKWRRPAKPPVAVTAPPKVRAGKFGHAVQWTFNRNSGRWVHANGAA